MPRETPKTSCIRITLRLTTTQPGIKPGILGPWPILESLVRWKPKLRVVWLIYLERESPLTLSNQLKVCCRNFSVRIKFKNSPGFFRSIALRNVDALQDTLRLLTLWFKFGAHDDVSNAMAHGFSSVEVDTWLEVIPQVKYPVLVPTNSTQIILDHCPYSNSTQQHS